MVMLVHTDIPDIKELWRWPLIASFILLHSLLQSLALPSNLPVPLGLCPVNEFINGMSTFRIGCDQTILAISMLWGVQSGSFDFVDVLYFVG